MQRFYLRATNQCKSRQFQTLVSEQNKQRRKVGQSIGLLLMTSQTTREALLFRWLRMHSQTMSKYLSVKYLLISKNLAPWLEPFKNLIIRGQFWGVHGGMAIGVARGGPGAGPRGPGPPNQNTTNDKKL